MFFYYQVIDFYNVTIQIYKFKTYYTEFLCKNCNFIMRLYKFDI